MISYLTSLIALWFLPGCAQNANIVFKYWRLWIVVEGSISYKNNILAQICEHPHPKILLKILKLILTRDGIHLSHLWGRHFDYVSNYKASSKMKNWHFNGRKKACDMFTTRMNSTPDFGKETGRYIQGEIEVDLQRVYVLLQLPTKILACLQPRGRSK